jgi:hypothetical protein
MTNEEMMNSIVTAQNIIHSAYNQARIDGNAELYTAIWNAEIILDSALSLMGYGNE